MSPERFTDLTRSPEFTAFVAPHNIDGVTLPERTLKYSSNSAFNLAYGIITDVGENADGSVHDYTEATALTVVANTIEGDDRAIVVIGPHERTCNEAGKTVELTLPTLSPNDAMDLGLPEGWNGEHPEDDMSGGSLAIIESMLSATALYSQLTRRSATAWYAHGDMSPFVTQQALLALPENAGEGIVMATNATVNVYPQTDAVLIANAQDMPCTPGLRVTSSS